MGRSKRTTRSKSTTTVASTSATSSHARDARRRRAGETTPNLSSIQSSAFASLEQFDENVIAAVSAAISPTRGSPVPDTPPTTVTPVAPVAPATPELAAAATATHTPHTPVAPAAPAAPELPAAAAPGPRITRRSTRKTRNSIACSSASATSSASADKPTAPAVGGGEEEVGNYRPAEAFPPMAERPSAAFLSLAELPPRRRPCLRPRHNEPNMMRMGNREAFLGQVAGLPAASPCGLCARSKGPWKGCVVVAGFFGGSCSNCHYGAGGRKCTLRTAGKFKFIFKY
jgi:hypothetical protein